MPDGWQPGTVEHTFSTGRTATLRARMPMTVLIRRALEFGESDILERLVEMEKGELRDASAAMRIQDAIVQTMFVAPRIYLGEEVVGDDGISINDLLDEEFTEVISLAFQGVAEADRFRGDTDGDGGGPDRKAVAKKSVKRSGAGARKS